jgi:mono/diheme cytochrome c family protein
MNGRSIAPRTWRTCLIAPVALAFAVPQTLHAQTTVLRATGDVPAGHAAFTQYCSICHGAGAQGFIGPRIAGINFGSAGVKAIVRHGLGGYGGMPAFSSDSVSDRNIDDIAAYLVSLGPPTAVAAPGPAVAQATVAAGGTAGDTVHGSSIFAANCASCHGAAGQGGFGPSLKNEQSRKDLAATVRWIENPAPPMPKLYPSPLSETDVADVAAFVERL